MIIPFQGSSSYDAEITNGIERVIGRIARFTLVERANLDRIIAEQKFQLSGMVSDRDMVRLGEMAGANKAITGHYTLNFERVRTNSGSFTVANLQLDVKIIDIETGKVDTILSDIRGQGSDTGHNRNIAFQGALDKSLVRFDHDVRDFYSLNFTVYRREGNVIIIRSGSDSGIQSGQYYSVLHNISIADPASETELIIKRERKGIVKIERADEEFSYAVIIEGIREIEGGMLLEENPAYYEKGSGIGVYFTSHNASEGFAPGFSLTGKTGLGEQFRMGLGVGMSFGEDVSTFDLFGIFGFCAPVVPELIDLAVEGRIGYLFAWQEGRDVQQYVDEEGYSVRSTNPSGGAVELGLLGGVEINLPRDFLFVLQVGYLFVPDISKWTLTEDREKDAEKWTVPEEFLQPSSFNASGIHFNIGIEYKRFRALF